MVSVSDMTYTNIGIFNGEDNGVRFVFQARTFRLLMWRMRLTLLPLPGIAVALVHKNIMTALGMPVPVCVGGAVSLTSVGFFHPPPPAPQIAKAGPLISGKLGHPSGRPGLTGRS